MPPLTETQRYQIEHDIRLGMSNELIAKGVGFTVRTIEREVSRCGGREDYRAAEAQAHRHRCANAGNGVRSCKLAKRVRFLQISETGVAYAQSKGSGANFQRDP